jgi:hypothetical protein
MLSSSELFGMAKRWVADHIDRLASSRIKCEVTESPEDRVHQSIWIIMESKARLAEIILWSTGHAEIQFAEVESGEVSISMHELATEVDVLAAMESLAGWMIPRNI